MTSMKILNQLTRTSLPPVTVLTGEEVGLYAQMKEALLAKVGYHPSDLTYSYFDMSESQFTDVAMDLESLPFFSDEKVVIVDHLQDITTDKKSYLSDHELKQLETYLERPATTTRLIICASGKLDGKRRLVKLLKRDGLILTASPMTASELRQHFKKMVKSIGLQFENGVFEALLAKSQYDFSAMSRNLAFLEAYKLDGEAISFKDIEEAIPKTLQDNIFDVTKLVLSGQVQEARELVADLRLQGEDEIKLIAIMLGRLRLLLQVRLLADRGRNEQQVVTDLSEYLGRQVNAGQVAFALRDSRAHSLKQLKQALTCLIETDFQIKTGVYDKGYLFDIALLKIAGRKG